MPLIHDLEVSRDGTWVILTGWDADTEEPWRFGLSLESIADAMAAEDALKALLGRVRSIRVGRGE